MKWTHFKKISADLKKQVTAAGFQNPCKLHKIKALNCIQAQICGLLLWCPGCWTGATECNSHWPPKKVPSTASLHVMLTSASIIAEHLSEPVFSLYPLCRSGDSQRPFLVSCVSLLEIFLGLQHNLFPDLVVCVYLTPTGTTLSEAASERVLTQFCAETLSVLVNSTSRDQSSPSSITSRVIWCTTAQLKYC